jgi:N-acetylmuramoyl-L-alanine amidase
MNRGSHKLALIFPRLLAGLGLWLVCQTVVFAEIVDFNGVRLWAAPDHSRVVFDTSGGVKHKIFSLNNPSRVVIDVPSARASKTLVAAKNQSGLVQGIRTARKDKDTLRIVLDLTQGAKPKSFSLKPNDKYGHRLVVDLY